MIALSDACLARGLAPSEKIDLMLNAKRRNLTVTEAAWTSTGTQRKPQYWAEKLELWMPQHWVTGYWTLDIEIRLSLWRPHSVVPPLLKNPLRRPLSLWSPHPSNHGRTRCQAYAKSYRRYRNRLQLVTIHLSLPAYTLDLVNGCMYWPRFLTCIPSSASTASTEAQLQGRSPRLTAMYGFSRPRNIGLSRDGPTPATHSHERQKEVVHDIKYQTACWTV